MTFRTPAGIVVPAVTAQQMREVDRVAVEEFGLSILQMMENAGRILAAHATEMLGGISGKVTVLAGSGGNGGGGLCAARHLHNQGIAIVIVLDRDAAMLTGPARSQMTILRAAGIAPLSSEAAPDAIRGAAVVIDALIGYGLRSAPTGGAADLINLSNRYAERVMALDMPSGVNATTGETPGPAMRADRTLTLALPKTGLAGLPGDLFLADIGIPPEVYGRVGLAYTPPFGGASSVRLLPS